MPKGGSQTVQTQISPNAQRYITQMRRAALGYAGLPDPGGNLQPLQPNLPPEIAQAQQQYGNYAQAGNLGLGALTGQPGAQGQFMNPYLNQMNPFFQQQRAGAVEGANQQSTLAGAFGGDRSQIGALLAGNQADQTQAQFNYQGFQDAMQRAAQAANLGFGAIGARAFLPQQYAQGQLGLLSGGLGPYGMSSTSQTQEDPWKQLAGLGITLASFA